MHGRYYFPAANHSEMSYSKHFLEVRIDSLVQLCCRLLNREAPADPKPTSREWRTSASTWTHSQSMTTFPKSAGGRSRPPGVCSSIEGLQGHAGVMSVFFGIFWKQLYAHPSIFGYKLLFEALYPHFWNLTKVRLSLKKKRKHRMASTNNHG